MSEFPPFSAGMEAAEAWAEHRQAQQAAAEAQRRRKDDLAALLRAHGQASHDPATGTFTCRSGDYTGPWLSVHQAELVLSELGDER